MIEIRIPNAVIRTLIMVVERADPEDEGILNRETVQQVIGALRVASVDRVAVHHLPLTNEQERTLRLLVAVGLDMAVDDLSPSDQAAIEAILIG